MLTACLLLLKLQGTNAFSGFCHLDFVMLAYLEVVHNELKLLLALIDQEVNLFVAK